MRTWPALAQLVGVCIAPTDTLTDPKRSVSGQGIELGVAEQ